jgi:hypothetical protein
LGDALASAAELPDLPISRTSSPTPVTVQPADDRRFVVAIPEGPLLEPALVSLITDPAVALHAMSALRRSIGSAAALPY